MKAWMLNGIGDIRLCEADVPVPAENEVRIKVSACGICGSDIPRIYETGAHRMPLIPGHEFSGVVEGIGKEAPPYWMGKRVSAFPLIPCGKCGPCRTGHPEMCRDYGYIGSRRDGAFAEYVTVPASNLIELPNQVNFEQAAMLEPMAVAVHAMRIAMENGRPIKRDEAVAVCGLGTIGLLLTGFLLDRGYENIYVIGNKDGQRRRTMQLGIPKERFCDSRNTDVPGWLHDRTGDGADVYFECVGKNECLCYGINAAAPGARVVTVGNPYSDMELKKDTYWKILRNQLNVCGSWNSTFLSGDFSEDNPDDWHYVLNRLVDGRIRPEEFITHELLLEGLERGLVIMRDKTEDYGKVMFFPQQ